LAQLVEPRPQLSERRIDLHGREEGHFAAELIVARTDPGRLGPLCSRSGHHVGGVIAARGFWGVAMPSTVEPGDEFTGSGSSVSLTRAQRGTARDTAAERGGQWDTHC
jgi:hypothetical protein